MWLFKKVGPKFFEIVPSDRWGIQPLPLILGGLVTILIGDHENGRWFQRLVIKEDAASALFAGRNTCVWGSELARKKSDYSEAAMLWGSQAKWRSHVWVLWLVRSLAFLTAQPRCQVWVETPDDSSPQHHWITSSLWVFPAEAPDIMQQSSLLCIVQIPDPQNPWT